MSQSDMVVFNSYVMPLITEMYPQAINKFNAASNNTIILSGEGFDGDFMEQSFYDALHSNQRRVDRYAVNGAVAPVDLTQSQHNRAKVAGGFGPLQYEPAQMTWLRKPTQEGLTVVANQFVEALLADQLNTSIKALVAAISNVAAVTNDVSGGANVTQGAINNGLALFGDRSQSIRALVMRGATYHRLVGEAITNATSLFEIGGVAVREGTAFGQGRPIIITDAPDLLNTTPIPDTESVLGLNGSAATISDNGDIITNVETTNGLGRIVTSVQTDYSFGLGLRGYTWDETNGGKSPDDADLGTGSNWDASSASIKDSAGVIITGDV